MKVKRVALIGLCMGALLAFSAMAEDPYAKPDDTWISISGTVDTVRPNSFTLDYGKGVITVEMDDGDRDADAYKLVKGDKVTVNGKIDDDLFETRTIEAGSVYVESLDTYFYASAADEEDTFVTVTAPVVISQTIVQGKVTEVSGEEFVVDAGVRKVRVDVSEMSNDPLDDEGYRKIKVGDRVSVIGKMDDDLFEGRELMAQSVVTLSGG
jgi:uncharacterized protein YdeI (BOF family)